MSLYRRHTMLAQPKIEKPSTFHIRGTSTAETETFYIKTIEDVYVRQIFVNVINGYFDYEYNQPLQMLRFDNNNLNIEIYNDTLTTIDLSDADDFSQLTNVDGFIRNCRALTRIYAPQTFENATEAIRFFWLCGNDCEFDFPNMTLVNANCKNMFGLTNPKNKIMYLPKFAANGAFNANNFFQNCPNIEEINFPLATFANVSSASQFVLTSKNLKKLKLPSATFASATNVSSFLYSSSNGYKIEELELSSATFASATDVSRMFYFVGYQAQNWQTLKINMPNATFASATNTQYMFGAFGGVEINLPNASFGNYDNYQYFCNECAHLTKINWGGFTGEYVTNYNLWLNKTIALTDVVFANTTLNKMSVSFQWCPLSYQSMLNVCNWLANVDDAQTLTLNRNAWNALTSEQQNTLTTIATNKNWNLALA